MSIISRIIIIVVIALFFLPFIVNQLGKPPASETQEKPHVHASDDS